MEKRIKIFQVYSVFLSIIVTFLLYRTFQNDSTAKYDQIEVGRINIIEPDGTLKMVLSNKTLFPQEIAMDGWSKKHERNTPGILFYNDEGIEAGGLIYSSDLAEDGSVTAGNHLSFDRYKQDQTIALTYQEHNGTYTSGLSFIDRPEKSIAQIEKQFESSNENEQQQMKANNAWGISRIWMGTAEQKPSLRGSYLVMNSDKGSQNFVLSVDEEEAIIRFLDKFGTVRLAIGLDSLNNPSIQFYNNEGKSIKSIQ